MRDYNEDNACPKCGCESVTTRYTEARWPARFGTDCLVRRCARCGHEWHETALDVVKARTQ